MMERRTGETQLKQKVSEVTFFTSTHYQHVLHVNTMANTQKEMVKEKVEFVEGHRKAGSLKY